MPPYPKPDGQVRHRNRPLANTVKLPAAGRDGPPPPFPLGELDEYWAGVWADLWATPAAAAWERNSWTRSVARYLLAQKAAERSLATARPSALILGEVRQMEDRLGLTPLSMLRLRWEIDADDEVEAKRSQRGPSSRRRIKAVDPGAVARA